MVGIPTRAAVVAALMALLGLLSACGSADLSATELEDEVSARLAHVDTEAPPMELRCAGGLAAEAGAHRDCRARLGEEHVDIRVSTTGADPLSMTVLPLLSADDLADRIGATLENKGHEVGDCWCSEPLMGRPGSATICRVWADGQGHQVRAVVTGLDGLTIKFKFEDA